MFVVDPEVCGFLAKHHHRVFIDYQYEPSSGNGLLCSKAHHGCWTPRISAGIRMEHTDYCEQQLHEGITIYYPPSMKLCPGTAAIRIRLRKLWRWQWLELEGAASLPCFWQ